MKAIGTVTEVNLYPVKSMQGISVAQAQLWWYGLDGDRKYAFVKSNNGTGFPWLTGRDYPELVRYEAYFADVENPVESAVGVQTLSGVDLALDDPELLQELTQKAGLPIHLLRVGRGVYDAMPISVISTTTVRTVSHAMGQDTIGQAVDARRFRANIVVSVDDGMGGGTMDGAVADENRSGGSADGFPEGNWLNKTLAFGDGAAASQIQTNYQTQRCSMINIDPETAERNPAVLNKVGELWEACAGIYATAKQLGTISVGDTVYISD